ncbi:HlyD family type I secretion periplasmic adaptor subunit [Nitrospira sp. KM1]|uniref:HlyD family type I secretion periplasmic adaptor subunit n=1 Tax=Nitrospira sp. KM1 TaxID=1936990 RepID=UPI0015667916|nr:HlyD family type I secretion periplasmic adaptor subunit [Nitrospira sp. KM1]
MIQTLARYVAAWCAAWSDDAQPSVKVKPAGRAVEFLPAVLEIQDRPPSPVGRAILWTIVAVFAAGILWAWLGWIDIIATAQGKIIPSGYSKVIQPYEAGVVAAIHVQDGQLVQKGETLVELDPTQNRADHDRSSNEYRAARVEAARLRALIAGRSDFDTPPGADPQYVRLQQQLLQDQFAEYRARTASAQHLIDQRKAAIEQTRENIRRLETIVPMEAERAEAFKRLFEHDAVTKMDFLQAETQRIDKTQELAGQKQRLVQDRSALAEAEKNLRALVSEFQQTKQTELSTAETKVASLVQEVTKASQKADLQRLTSPIDGVVQQLAIHTVGGVVTSAQPLLIVVPQDHPVEVEAHVENKDVGFVREGQDVEIKVETFPFTLYGTVPGRVISLSDDAVPIEKGKDKPQAGLIFSARVSLDRSMIKVEGQPVQLSPGMAVTVEIKTGRRRVMEYLLSPLLKSVKESLRER